MPVTDAFAHKESLARENEMQSYHLWLHEKFREKDDKTRKPGEPGKGKILMEAERDTTVVNHAMQSANNYLGFIQSRGFS